MTQQELPVNVRVVRLFDADGEALTRAVEALRAQSALNVQSMVRGSETLVVMQSDASSYNVMCAALEACEKRLRADFPNDIYGTGSTTLTVAVLEALRARRVLFACADAQTGALLEPKLENLQGAEEIYDFGAQSYAHPKLGAKIAAAGQKADKKWPDDPVRAAALRVHETYHLSGADWALGLVEAPAGTVVLLGGKHECCARLLRPEESTALALLDLLRRAVLELEMPKNTRWLIYGRRSGFDAAGFDTALTEEELRRGRESRAAAQNAAQAPKQETRAEAPRRGQSRGGADGTDGTEGTNGAGGAVAHSAAVQSAGAANTAASRSDARGMDSAEDAGNPSPNRTSVHGKSAAETAARRILYGEESGIADVTASRTQGVRDESTTASRTQEGNAENVPEKPAQNFFADPPARANAHTPQKNAAVHRHSAGRAAAALLVVALVAAAAVGGVWLYTGGDIASFWEKSGLRQFNLSNASLLWLALRG